MIEVNNLYKEFDGTPVLKGINATFENGKTSLVIGTSGSGKTVFLKCMLGLLYPEKGDISYDGNIYNEMSDDVKRDLKKDIGMVFQGSALFDSSTVEENVMFPLKMFTNQPYAERMERVNFVLNRVNLENANKKFPAELSGGMQKRVAIARAIVMNPKYLFCDEPNSGLDPRTSTVIDNLIQEITQEYNITTIINSHDMNSVMEIGEKIILLKDGVKAWEGTSDEVFRTDNEDLTNFVYSSNLFKKVRQAQLREKGL
ncbi:ATP-binding cassette domain-containing protein [Aureibaculum sp. 2210JD6-5]|uniref:ABC transporter ATP-binding protein n=1 Tax=Aureibaculum sp. 2210JD6-5 TaxID=3103957 RepID=UPI002AAF04F3|nr:ATP-binding cassette domain-containing protein [Aureibaculum sp. 2210JD6-5]MDY7395396.1 ATP-binding cassette domain-containing protein [Aureibaculum sp. 2210JD6-5]